jgi:branched-chain amino acid transport system substrate-binding protein
VRRAAGLLLLLAACGRPASGHVGLLLPLSGPLAERGHEMRVAVDLALAELPEDRRPQVLQADSQGSARHTTMAYGDLVDEGATVVLGPLTTDEVEAAALVARALRVPCVAPAATGAHPEQADDWTLRLCYSDDDAARALAGWARMTLHLERLVSVIDLRSAYSLGLARAFSREFSRLNGRIVGEVTYHGGDSEAAGVLDAVAALPAEGALLAGYLPDIRRMLDGASDPRLAELVLLGGDGWGGAGLSQAFAGRVRGAYHTRHYDPGRADPLVTDFETRWRAATGEAPSDAAALTFDAARAVLSVFDAHASGPALRDRLFALPSRDGVTGPLDIDARGVPVRRPIYLEQVHEAAGASIVAEL